MGIVFKKVAWLTSYLVCLFVSHAFASFGQLLSYVDKRIVNIIKV